MSVLRVGLVQTCSGDDPARNVDEVSTLIRRAADEGAELIATPEVTNIVTFSRRRQHALLRTEAEDESLAAYRALATELGRPILLGSLALLADEAAGPGDAPFVNRSLLLSTEGDVAARYDKIHMFDVEVGEGERYRESAAYRPGARAVVADPPGGPRLGLTICYDMRFPALYRALAEAGAQVLTAPSAFTVPTGRAHWRTLLRARAIETGCFVVAPAQTGTHPASQDGARIRRTYGHSLAVAPWGEVLADGGEAVGVTLADLDLDAVAEARARVPSLANARAFAAPEGSAQTAQTPHSARAAE
ncbi:MAG: carbon-nitrogen hydrolase family protein [Pseudomonadota bacterium]